MSDTGVWPKRSPLWSKRQKAHLKIQPFCLVCGDSRSLQAHHKYPFHFVIAVGRPDLELDERNLFTLCTDTADQHHVLVGHLDDYESYNPDLEQMIALTRGLLSSQIRSLRVYIDAVKRRPRHLPSMLPRDRDALRDELDLLMPRVL